MSETLESTLTVLQARAVLQNTRGMGGDQIDAAQKVVNAFHAARPRRACVACGCMIWSEHSDGDDRACWACDRCHKPATLTQAVWFEQQRAERETADAHLRATEAAAPDPRAALSEALGRLEAARAGLSKLEAALPAARATLAAARLKCDRATTAAEEVNGAAAEHLAASFEGRTPGEAPPTAAAARAALAAAADALAAARGAQKILDDKITDARAAVGYASERAKRAARGVLAAERLEELLGDAAEARANYLDSVGQLGWLLRNHAIPNGDARARQLVADANTPPSAWREAATAGIAAMEDGLAALLADAEADIQ